LLPKTLENRIEKRQRILYALEPIPPTCEGVPNFDRAHVPTSRLIDDGSHKVRPRDFCLYLLTKGSLKADLRSLQLGNFRIQLVALARFQLDFASYFPKSVLEGACHGYN